MGNFLSKKDRTPSTLLESFERTIATYLLDAGVDLATIQVHIDHSSPITTSFCDRREESARWKAVQKLFVMSFKMETQRELESFLSDEETKYGEHKLIRYDCPRGYRDSAEGLF